MVEKIVAVYVLYFTFCCVWLVGVLLDEMFCRGGKTPLQYFLLPFFLAVIFPPIWIPAVRRVLRLDSMNKSTSSPQLPAENLAARNRHKEMCEKINRMCISAQPGFWVPALGNGQIVEFIRFVLKHRLVDELVARDREANFALVVAEVCHRVGPNFWVPAVGNGQVGEFVRLVNKFDLWPSLASVVGHGQWCLCQGGQQAVMGLPECQMCHGSGWDFTV